MKVGSPEVAEARGVEEQLTIRRAIKIAGLESLGFGTVPNATTNRVVEQRLHANGRHD